jgi:hypothetical protein
MSRVLVLILLAFLEIKPRLTIEDKNMHRPVDQSQTMNDRTRSPADKTIFFVEYFKFFHGFADKKI